MSPERSRRLGPRGAWRGVAARAVPFLLIWGLAFTGFMLGVTVDEPLGMFPIAARAYHALGLFVVGGLDLGMPTGGPRYAVVMVWVSYFLAPLLTATALLEAALRMFSPLTLRYRMRNADVVIAGCGSLTNIYLQKLRAADSRARVVIVELDPANARIAEARELYGAVVIIGDITSDVILGQFRMDRARRVLLLTGSDFTNLNAAAKILRMAPELARKMVIHVSDLNFMRSVADTSVVRDCETFNSHEVAAVHLVKEKLLARFQSTAYRDPVVLAGFGRFGQTVLHQLQLLALGSFGKVVIVDFEATKGARMFSQHPGFSPENETQVIDGDLRDPLVWAGVKEALATEVGEPVVVVGSGEDATNLHAALDISKQYSKSYIVARSSGESPFAADVSLAAGVHPINISAQVSAGMPGHWFSGS